MEYFHDIENYFDILNIILSPICLLLIFFGNSLYLHELLEVLTLILIFLRGMLFLKVFSKFRHLVRMIFKIFRGSLIPIFLMGYVILGLSIAYGRASGDKNKSLKENLKINVSLIFGEIPDIESMNNFLQGLLIFFALIFTAIVMINFLIAKLTNEFSELEKKQKVLFYQEMAQMEYEFELIYKKFKKPIKDLKFCYFAIPLSQKSKNKDYFENFEEKIKKLEFRLQKNSEKNFEEIKTKNEYHFKKNKLNFRQIFSIIDSKKNLNKKINICLNE